MIRPPAVADRFYPGNPAALSEAMDKLIQVTPSQQKTDAFAVVSPHAGYIYSGKMAGKTLAQVNIPETVLLLGPNHHGQGEHIALSNSAWETPLGTISISSELNESLLQESPLIRQDELAHLNEHSLEVQLPFLQALQPRLHISAISLFPLDYKTCEELARAIAAAISKCSKKILILASSDMSHFLSREEGSKLDHMALEQILNMDPAGLYNTVRSNNISMCGMIPVAIALKAALIMGATKSDLIGYTDSGETTGDTVQVVGYAGLIIS